MFETIRDLIPRDRDLSARTHALTVLKRTTMRTTAHTITRTANTPTAEPP